MKAEMMRLARGCSAFFGSLAVLMLTGKAIAIAMILLAPMSAAGAEFCAQFWVTIGTIAGLVVGGSGFWFFTMEDE